MKMKEEQNALDRKDETRNRKPRELNEEELKQVAGSGWYDDKKSQKTQKIETWDYVELKNMIEMTEPPHP